MKLFLVYKLNINNQEPTHYANHSQETLVGIYDTIEKATDKIDELYIENVNFQQSFPEYDFMDETVSIVEQQLNSDIV